MIALLSPPALAQEPPPTAPLPHVCVHDAVGPPRAPVVVSVALRFPQE